MSRTALLITILVLCAGTATAGTFSQTPYLAEAQVEVSDPCEQFATVPCALRDLEWTGEAIHDALYCTAQELGMKPKEMFKAVYMTILGQTRGPRLGYFLSYLDKEFVLDRLSEPAR